MQGGCRLEGGSRDRAAGSTGYVHTGPTTYKHPLSCKPAFRRGCGLEQFPVAIFLQELPAKPYGTVAIDGAGGRVGLEIALRGSVRAIFCFQQWLAAICSSRLRMLFLIMSIRNTPPGEFIVSTIEARLLARPRQFAFRCSSRCCFAARSAGVPNSMVASIARSHGLSVMTVLPLILHVLTVCATAVGSARQTRSGRIVRISSPRLLNRRNNITQGSSVRRR